MKILHFSDTHLGFNDLELLDENNINQREADFYDAFSQITKQIIELKPDYIIHTGDLFHRSSPSNRAISFALEQFKILDSLNIPIILIAGNHSTPRTNLSSPILKIFDNFENIYTSYNQEYKKIEFKEIIFHTLPHMNDENKANEQINLCEQNINSSKKNIMMLHCSVGAWYLMEEFGEWVYPSSKEYIFSKMDYVALGHWHGFGKVGKHENVYYSGSSERTSLNDKRNSKGFAFISIKEHLNVEYKEIKIRPIVLKELDGLNLEENIKLLDLSDTKDAIVELTLKNISTLQSMDITNKFLKELFPSALYVSIKREFIKDTNNQSYENVQAISLESYFLEHLEEQGSNEEERIRLKSKVQELFVSYEENNSDTI